MNLTIRIGTQEIIVYELSIWVVNMDVIGFYYFANCGVFSGGGDGRGESAGPCVCGLQSR